MQHLPNPEHPPFVSDRLSAVSNVPMQFLLSVGMVAVILLGATLADSTATGEGTSRFVDAQQTASVDATERGLMIGDGGWNAINSCFLKAALQTLTAE
jgi:hypothetical protein